MGNIDITTIRRQNFKPGSIEEMVEDSCIQLAKEHTDDLIYKYNQLEQSRGGRYINSDLLKMVFPIYSESSKNRRQFNMSITNTAAVLTNEAYLRTIRKRRYK